MILSAASDLQTRQTRWVARKNDGESFYRLSTNYGVSAVSIAAQFADAHAADHSCPISGWRSTQWG